MPETGSQILNYTGSAALGQGSNANIPVINPNSNLDAINDATKNIALWNHDTNIRLYDQKIKDRDATLAALAAGEISSGDINGDDRPYYDTATKNVKDEFDKMIAAGGINNTEAYRKYLDKVKDLNDVVTQAQSRNVELKKLKADQSAMSVQEDYDKAGQHINQQLQKSFWQPIDPYQKAFTYDVGALTNELTGQANTLGILGTSGETPSTQQTTYQSTTQRTDKSGNVLPTTKTTVKTAPVKTGLVNNKTATKPITISGNTTNPDGTISPFSYTPEQYYDLPTMMNLATEKAASNPATYQGYQSYLTDFTNDKKIDPDQQVSTLRAYNNRIADYSVQRGIAQMKNADGTPAVWPDGSPKYPDQIKYYQDPISKKVLIQETPVSFFAKHALASINGDYVQTPKPVFNKDIAKYDIDLKKANTDQIYKYWMGKSAWVKANAYADFTREKLKTLKTANAQDNYLDDMYTRNLVSQPLFTQNTVFSETPGKPGTFSLNTIQADNSRPIYTMQGGKTPSILPPIGGMPIYDKYDTAPDPDKQGDVGVPQKGAKIIGYKGGYYKPTALFQGKPIDTQTIQDQFNQFKKTKFGKQWNGTLEDYFKEALQHNKYDLQMQGAEGGVTDKQINAAAERLISNPNTKKGQIPVFDDSNPPTDETGVSEESSSENSASNNSEQ